MCLKQYGGNYLEEIKPEELENINGGGITIWAALAGSLALVFFIGVYDGYTRPLACH